MDAAHGRKEDRVGGMSDCYLDSSMRRSGNVMPDSGERANSSGSKVRNRDESLLSRKFEDIFVKVKVMSSRYHEERIQLKYD